MRILLTLVVLVGVLSFAQNNNYTPDRSWKAPEKAAQAHNPVANSKEAVQQGRSIYDAQCSMCHGADGQGLSNAANFHVAAVQSQSDGSLFWKITNGHPSKGMPSFKLLSDSDRWSLVSYLRTFRKK